MSIFQHALQTEIARPVFPVCLTKQSERTSVVAIRTNTRCTDPNVSRFGFINRVNVVFTKTFYVGELGKRRPVVMTYTAISSHLGLVRLDACEPDVSLLIFQDAGDVVATETIFLCEMSERFSIKLIGSVAIGAKPKVARFVIKFQRNSTGEDGKGLDFIFNDRGLEFNKRPAVGAKDFSGNTYPEVALFVGLNSSP